MPFLQWRSTLTTTFSTRDEAPKGFLATSTAPGRCGPKFAEATSPAIGDEKEAGWSALSILQVFHLVHIAVTADADVSACVDEMSTAELVASVRRLLCMGQLPSSNSSSSTSKQAVVSPYVTRALLLRLRGLVEAHERFLTWMHTRSMGAVPGVLDDAETEDAFLADAAAFLRTLPPPDVPQTSSPSPRARERCEQSSQLSYAQLLSSNLYAISTFMDVSVTATTTTGAPPRAPASPSSAVPRGLYFLPNPVKTTALTLLYYLITLTVDVLESSVLRCCRPKKFGRVHACESEQVRSSQGPVGLPIVSTPAARFSASPSAAVTTTSLHVILCSVLQEEGSRLLERLLRYEQREGRCDGEGADTGPSHHRLLTRHVLRRLGHLFFRPLRIDLTHTGIVRYPTAAVASDHTDAALVSWMAEQLRRIMDLDIPTAGREGPDRTSQDFPAPLADEDYRPCRFETECLAELLRLLVTQIDTGASPSPSPGADECGCHRSTNAGGRGSTVRHASVTADGALRFSRLPEYMMCFAHVTEAAGAQGGGALTNGVAGEALMRARAHVVGYWRHLGTK